VSKIVLQPCKLREDKFVPVKGAESVNVDLGGFIKLLGLDSKKDLAVRILRELRVTSYVGRHEGRVFSLYNPDLTSYVGWLLKTKPTFGDNLQELWRVESIAMDSKVSETA